MRRAILVAALGILALGYFVVAPKSTGGPPLRDFEAYYAAGATARLDGDPYGRDVWRVEKDVPGVVASRDEFLPFVGPPFGLPLWSLLGALAWPNAVLLWEGVMAVSFATLAFGALRLAGGAMRGEDAVAVAILAAGFGPLTSGTALGQSAVVACAAIVATLLLLRRGPLLGAVATALAAALQPNLAPALAVHLGDRRAALALGGAAVLAVAGSALELGHGGLGRYLTALADHAASERFIAIQTTPGAVARALGAPAALAGTLPLAVAAVTAALVALQCATRRYGPLERVALAGAALPLALPFAHEHDFALAFLPAVLCLRTSTGTRWIAAACATLAVGVDWLGLAQRPTGVAATALFTLAAALALAVLARGPLRPYHFAPVAAAALVLTAGGWAARHPVPTWPQALPLDFHVPATLGAAATWHLEQVASGIATLDPAWGLLRLASLLGCAGLWATASVALARDERAATALPSARPSRPGPETGFRPASP
jgi:hypothetical protein